MKAVRIREYGAADVLRYEEAPEPVVGADDVLIRLVGTSVNPVDWKIRQGYLKDMIPFHMPFIPGWDVFGVVQAVGEIVAKYKVGDSVFSRPDIARNGTYAEFISVREVEVARKPQTISHIEAGVLPLAGITAWEAMITVAQVAAGQRVLIHAAAGGVGSLGRTACEVARRLCHRHRVSGQSCADRTPGRRRVDRLAHPAPAGRSQDHRCGVRQHRRSHTGGVLVGHGTRRHPGLDRQQPVGGPGQKIKAAQRICDHPARCAGAGADRAVGGQR